MKGPICVFAAVMLAFFAPFVISSNNDFRTLEYTAPYIAPTAPGVTTADVVLTEELFNEATANIVISSNNPDDAPLPFEFVGVTNTLTVSGLAADDTRTLTIVYKISALGDYFGSEIVTRIWPTFYILCLIALAAAGVYQTTRRGEFA